MGSHTHGVPEHIVLPIAQKFGIDTFVETGTYYGASAMWASASFDSVYTIELFKDYHEAAKEKLSSRPNVTCLLGDSKDVLPHVLDLLNTAGKPAVFFLDAHWSFDLHYGRPQSECPIQTEIAVINSSPLNHVIIVDDARLFITPPPAPHRAEDWPKIDTLMSLLRSTNRRSVTIRDDVIVATPIRDTTGRERELIRGLGFDV